MTRRRLRPEEIELWRKVTDTTHRLYPERQLSELPKPKPKPVKKAVTKIQAFEIAHKVKTSGPMHDILPTLSERLQKSPLRMDQKTHKKLTRGKIIPEGKIDLHGMTLDQAHPALTSFILRAHRNSKRLILVVTGKGRITEQYGRRGVLKHQVPHWLSLPPISAAVLQITEAHQRHGGSGAFYVYLKRGR